MAEIDDNWTSVRASSRSPNQGKKSMSLSLSDSAAPRNGCSNDGNNDAPLLPENASSPEDFIASAAAKIASQPLPCSDPDVWGVLTAISDKARKRKQGMNMLLISDEHSIGRLVDDATFQIISPAVSARHCKIYRKPAPIKDEERQSDICFSVFLKDTSTNGTYLNWEKLSKSSLEVKLSHGDIISIAFAPQHELAYAFVYREVKISSTLSPCRSVKRKLEEYFSESKRLKGIGIGASDGPVSLDDFRSLQRSNTDLRKLLEEKVATIESICSDNRAISQKHEIEMKELEESVTKPYIDKLFELNQTLKEKDKELVELNRTSAEQKHVIEGLDQRLSASMQSCLEANEIINSQKTSISELKVVLDEERDQRREERYNASVNMKMALEKVQAEATEEIKRVSDSALRREKELQELLYKLQEVEKERCSMMETMRSKLEDTRQSLVTSDNKVRQLECQIFQEQEATAVYRKKVEEHEHDRRRLRKELENEKAAREEAWAKVSALELEISVARRDLDYERRRLKAARERIMLRETQLRAFYSTTEEIQVLFGKQQEQLKAMQRTLEDEENYETKSMDADLNPDDDGKRKAHKSIAVGKLQSCSFLINAREKVDSSSDEASATEKHDCNAKTQENGEDTQEVDFTGVELNAKGGFGSDINGLGTAPASDDNPIETEPIPETEGAGTAQILETEHVSETESQEPHNGCRIGLNKCSTLLAEKIRDTTVHGSPENIQKDCAEPHLQSETNRPCEADDPMHETEGAGTIRTADLLASEVAGSWACSTVPSVHGEYESAGSKDIDEGCVIPENDSNSVVAESQHILSSTRRDHENERRALSEMIGIVAPDMREHFCRAIGIDDRVGSVREDSSSGCSDCNDDEDPYEDGGREGSDGETVGSERAVPDDAVDPMNEDDETQDSVG